MAKVYNNAGILAAQVAGLDPEMDAAAERVKAEIKSRAARHHDTGAFADSFDVRADLYRERGVMDRGIESDDPAALSIEYGHFTRRSKSRRLRKWVPGLMIVNEAVNKFR